MDETNYRIIAGQLRKPHGEMATEVGEKMNETNLLMNKETIAVLDPVDNDHILEIGMGNGFFVKDILSQHQGIRYEGFDYSEEMVKDACQRNAQYIRNNQAQFRMAEASNMPYSDAQFNKVFTVNTIYFWDDVRTVFSEIRRVLQRGGILIIAIRPQSVMDNFPITQHGFNTFSNEGIADLLKREGFKVETMTEKQEADLVFFGEKLPNAYIVAKAILI